MYGVHTFSTYISCIVWKREARMACIFAVSVRLSYDFCIPIQLLHILGLSTCRGGAPGYVCTYSTGQSPESRGPVLEDSVAVFNCYFTHIVIIYWYPIEYQKEGRPLIDVSKCLSYMRFQVITAYVVCLVCFLINH